jgi:hypothetical protein
MQRLSIVKKADWACEPAETSTITVTQGVPQAEPFKGVINADAASVR